MVIIFHLFDRLTLRFSELERTIPGVSQKMLIQQLRASWSATVLSREKSIHRCRRRLSTV